MSKRKINIRKSLDPNTNKPSHKKIQDDSLLKKSENKVRRKFTEFLKDELINSFSREYYENNH